MPKINRTIFLLMLSDIFVGTGFGLIDPILAIFFKENIVGGTILTAGFASTLFLMVKSIVQLPFSKYVDSHKKKVKWLIVGSFLISSVPIIYIFSENIWHIYIAQIIMGIGSGLSYPTWLGIWSTHLDKNHESFEWSLYSTISGIGVALTASIGAALAEFVGFSATFITVGIFSIIGTFILFWLEKSNHKESLELLHFHTKRKLINKRHH